VFMFLKAESENYPLYRIENRADETLFISQKGTLLLSVATDASAAGLN
jgi:hypothetical protein